MNKQRYAAILKQIKEHPETWNQGLYHNDCGTTHCVAGWAEVHALASGRWGVETDFNPVDPSWSCARSWLGISENEADYLFDAIRTLDELKAVARNGFPDWVYEEIGPTEVEDAR